MAAVTLKGNPVTLSGTELKVGDAAPAFTLQSTGLADVALSAFAGKTVIVASVPSLDTPTCHKETKEFNDKAKGMPDVPVLVVSTDLPFGMKRWCGSEGVENVQTLSDHRTAAFGKAYGVLISGGPLDRCLCRAIFVVKPDGKLAHVEYVKEIAEEPNYSAALAAAQG